MDTSSGAALRRCSRIGIPRFATRTMCRNCIQRFRKFYGEEEMEHESAEMVPNGYEHSSQQTGSVRALIEP